jgi:hypothetical protein
VTRSACSPAHALPHTLFRNSRTSVLYTQRTYFFNSRRDAPMTMRSLAATSKAKRDFGYAATVSVRQGIDMVVKVRPLPGARTLCSCCC